MGDQREDLTALARLVPPARRGALARLACFAGAGTGTSALLLALLQSAAVPLLAGAAGTYSLRHLVHLHLKYHRHPRDRRGRLRRWTLADAVVAGTFDTSVAALIAMHAPGTATMVVAPLALVAMMIVSGGTVNAARAPGLKLGRGSEWVRRISWVRGLEGALEPSARHFGKPFLAVLRLSTPVREVSCCVVVLMLILAAVTMTEGASRVKPIRTFFHLRTGAVTKSEKLGAAGRSRPLSVRARHLHAPRSAVQTQSLPPVPASAPVTYASLCGATVAPGDGAPAPYARALRTLWLGGDGRDGVGALVAGCAESAYQEPGQPGVWLVPGECDGDLRSLGIATPQAPPQLVLQQVARFAQRQARRRALLGASARVHVGAGDLQAIETTHGNYVLARQTNSKGRRPASSDAQGCAQLTDANASYVIVPPAVVELWTLLIGETWVWPVETAPGRGETRAFAFVTDGGQRTIAFAGCRSDGTCQMALEGRTVQSEGRDPAAADGLVRMAQSH